MANFQGPYQMPKGASGRVPPVGGGTIANSGVNPPAGGWPRGRAPAWPGYGAALNRARGSIGNFGSFAAWLANVDPGRSRHAARAWNAYLSQFLPGWYYRDGWWNYSGWSRQKQPGVSPGWYVPSPWCRWAPGAPWCSQVYEAWGAVLQAGEDPSCANVDSCSAAGLPYAMPIDNTLVPYSPFNITVISVGELIGVDWGQRNGAFACPPTPFGSHPTEVPQYRTGAIVLPQPEGEPEPSYYSETQYQTQTQTSVGLKGSYQVAARTVAFTYHSPAPGEQAGGSGGVSDGGGVHNQLPPPPGTKERKVKANYGAAGAAYGFVTEVQDMSDCLVKALKAGGAKGRAPGRWDLPGRAMWIAKNSGFLDDKAMGAFIECVATQEVGDSLMGAASRGIDRRFRAAGYNGLRGFNGGRPSGLAMGPHQQGISNALSKRMR